MRASRSIRVIVFLLTIGLLMLPGCAEMNLPSFPGPDKAVQITAEQHFINGDFTTALLEFEQIYETALVPDDRIVALYGLACTQMILARTEDELTTAINNLQRWDALKGSAPLIENHHLLVLALKQQAELINKRQLDAAQKEEQKNRLIANQKNKINQMAKTMEVLKKQLDELEAIDETFQLKRKL